MQEHSSAGTSVNQLPAILGKIDKLWRAPEFYWAEIHDVLDYGGGKYEKLTEALAARHVRNHVYDPYNRSAEHNEKVAQAFNAKPADAAICSNVLNVIKEPHIRQEVLKQIANWTDGWVFFTVYEGKHRDSRGRKTVKGWQANRPLHSYLREIKRVFPRAIMVYGMIAVDHTGMN